MNPQAGDTVTSTKSLSSSTKTKSTNKNITTILTTTGERNSGRIAPRPDTKAATRKRRQQPQEATVPTPVKSRRRGEPPGNSSGATGGSGGNRSRLGDFFSTLASRIRGTKTTEATTMVTEENLEDRQAQCDKAAEMSVGKKQSYEPDEDVNTDSNKRRKIEHIDCSDTLEPLEMKDEKVEENVETSETTDLRNDCLESEPTVVSENQVPQCPPQANEDNETKIIDVCRDIVADMSEKIQNADKPCDSLTNLSTVVVATDPDDTATISVEEKRESSTESMMAVGKRKYASIKAELMSKSSRTSIGSASSQSRRSAITDDRKEFSYQESTSGTSSLKFPMKSRKDEGDRLRKTIQWLEENARRLREDLANARSELHEERRASKLLRRELDAAVREARSTEAAKFTGVISVLKARLSMSPTRVSVDSQTSQSKTDLLKEENHKREITALKNRLAEAETTIQKLKTDSLDRARCKKKSKDDGKVGKAEVRKLEVEVQTLRAANKKLEEKLQIAEESGRARAAELRQEHERHEAEMVALQKALRSDTIKMIDEIQSKSREIEKLEKLVSQSVQINEKLRSKEDETMRKLRESEKSRLAPRLEEKIHRDDDEHEVDQCKVECEVEEANMTELDRLRELAIDQKEVIEMLRQAIKEKDRKLDCMIRKQQKEAYYKQYINLETVAEVDDESDEFYEEGDSALSSAPSSLSPQPGSGGCRNGCVGPNGVTVEVYRSLLLEVEELQTKLLEEQSELSHARSQVRDLEKALLQETRGSQTSRLALNEKLREAAEREARLQEKIADLTEINDNLEFRVLELEELPNQRDTPDPADSGIVSPEPTHLYKDQQTHHHHHHHEERVVATITPYTYTNPTISSEAQKSLSLQESGIFEDEDVDYNHSDTSKKSKLSNNSSQSTQTEAPAGELLQEVQRLQELRVRIQERAAKIPPPPLSPIDDRKSKVRCECSAELVPLREKVTELEERVSSYEKERQISKQREEELLDENDKLVERVFSLEAELKDLEEKLNEVKFTSDAEVMTDDIELPVKKDFAQQYEIESLTAEVDEKLSTTSKRGNLYKAAVVHLDDEPKTSYFADIGLKTRYCLRCCDLFQESDHDYDLMPFKKEVCMRKRANNLERSGSIRLKTSLKTEEDWAKLQTKYEDRLKDMVDQLSAQREINRSLINQLIKARDKEPMEVDEVDSTVVQTDEVKVSRSPSLVSEVSISSDSKVTTVSRTDIKMVISDVNESSSIVSIVEPPAEVAIEAKEGDPLLRSVAVEASQEKSSSQAPSVNQQTEPDALVSIANNNNSSGEKKQIIYFRWR